MPGIHPFHAKHNETRRITATIMAGCSVQCAVITFIVIQAAAIIYFFYFGSVAQTSSLPHPSGCMGNAEFVSALKLHAMELADTRRSLEFSAKHSARLDHHIKVVHGILSSLVNEPMINVSTHFERGGAGRGSEGGMHSIDVLMACTHGTVDLRPHEVTTRSNLTIRNSSLPIRLDQTTPQGKPWTKPHQT